MVSPTFIAEMAAEVKQRDLQQNCFAAKGSDLKNRVTAKMRERSDSRGFNPHFRVPPLTPSTLKRVKQQVAPAIATARIATSARQAAVLSVLNPITRGAVAGNMTQVLPALNANIDAVLFELGDKMGDKPKVLMSPESRKILGGLGLQPTITRKKHKYRVVQVVMTNTAAGEQIQAVIVFRDTIFEGCVSHRINDGLSIVLMHPQFNRPKFFAHFLGRRVLPCLFGKRRALAVELDRVRVPDDVGAMNDDELVASGESDAEDAEDGEEASQEDDVEEAGADVDDDEEEGEDFAPYQLDAEEEENDDEVEDEDEADEDDVVVMEEHITISFDGEHAQIQAAGMESVLKLCDDRNVSLVKSSGGNSLKEAPADRGLAHSKLKNYMRTAKYEDDADKASPNMRTFIKDVLMSKSCKLKPDSKGVLRTFLYNVENALSHAWTRSTVIESWKLVGIWPLSFEQLLSQCLAWRDVNADDATIILGYIGCWSDMHMYDPFSLFLHDSLVPVPQVHAPLCARDGPARSHL